MDMIEAFQRVGLALAIGLLAGVERGWQERDLADGQRVAGIRTFALVGLLGGLAGYLGVETGPVVPAMLAAGLTIAFVVFEYLAAGPRHDFSVTGVVAALVVFTLGIVSATGDMRLAAAGGVVATVLLAARHALHGFLKSMTWVELRSALVLLAMSFVALPLLPNRAIDPWGGFNPFFRLADDGNDRGALLCRLCGYAHWRAGARHSVCRCDRRHRVVNGDDAILRPHLDERNRGCLTGLRAQLPLLAGCRWCAVFVIAGAVAPDLMKPLAFALAPGLLTFLLASFLLNGSRGNAGTNAQIQLSNPFELWSVLRFGALLGFIGFVAKLLVKFLGPASIVFIALVSGIPDLDAITLSTAHLAGGSVSGSDRSSRGADSERLQPRHQGCARLWQRHTRLWRASCPGDALRDRCRRSLLLVLQRLSSVTVAHLYEMVRHA